MSAHRLCPPPSSLCALKLASKRWAHPLSNNRTPLDDVIFSQSASLPDFHTGWRLSAVSARPPPSERRRGCQPTISVDSRTPCTCLTNTTHTHVKTVRTVSVYITCTLLSKWLNKGISHGFGLVLLQCAPQLIAWTQRRFKRLYHSLCFLFLSGLLSYAITWSQFSLTQTPP